MIYFFFIFETLLLFPLMVLATEVILAFCTRNIIKPSVAAVVPKPEKSFVVLIPAHNEERGIQTCLFQLEAVNRYNGRLLVVADNCSDQTADIAKQHGAMVVERVDVNRKGKGYALQFGMDALQHQPPETVVILDADCSITPAELFQLVAESQNANQIVQSRYLMHAPTDGGLGSKISEFAWLLKTYVRPLGTSRLMGCAQLLGSGMAFPWHVLNAQSLASGHVVEDLKLTMELAEQGIHVKFFPQAVVHSDFPAMDQARMQQSSRWEHGHLQMALTEVPKLFFKSLLKRQPKGMLLALDILVLPLSLFAVLLAGGTLCSLLLHVWVDISFVFFYANLLYLALFIAVIAIAWKEFGTHILTGKGVLQIPFFVLKKLNIYKRFITNREKKWIRTDRS